MKLLDARGPAHFVGKNVFDLFPREVAEVLWQNDLAAQRLGGVIATEETVAHRDGSQHTYLTNKFAINKSGQLFATCAVSVDITERKQAEEALRDSEEWFRALADSVSVGIFIYQGERLVYANRASERLSGYTAEELRALRFWELIHPEHRELARERGLARQRGGPVPESYEVKIVRKDGAERWMDFIAGSIRWKEKPAVIGTVSDITERKRAEEALRQSRHLLERVLASLKDAIFLIDPSTRRITFCNASVQRVFGYTEGETIGRNTEFLHVDRAMYDEFGAQLFAALKAGGVWRTEYRMRRKDGSVFLTENTVTEVVDAAGQRTGVVSVVRDITERKQAERALRDYAERLQGLSRRLVEVEETERRNINRELHDRVGQSLAALNINLNIIRSQLPRESLGAVGARFQGAQRLIEETAAQIRDIMADLHPPALDDYGLLTALRAYAEASGARLAVPIAVQGDELLPRLPRDAELALFRIAQGALANAIAHARAQRIEITLAATAGLVTLVIADDGVGFDAAHPKLARASWGLAIMRERAEAVGAKLSIETAPGRGTRVVVEIAREEA